MYGGEYGEERLRPWTERIRALAAQTETVWVYLVIKNLSPRRELGGAGYVSD
jgi:hypothetical protein